MRTSQTKTIGDFEVTTTKLPTLRGSRLLLKVQRVLSSKAGEIDTAMIASALSQLPDDDVEKLLAETLVCTSILATGPRGDKIKYDLDSLKNIDAAFDGDVEAMWAVVGYVWEVNFSRPTKGVAVGQPDPAP